MGGSLSFCITTFKKKTFEPVLLQMSLKEIIKHAQQSLGKDGIENIIFNNKHWKEKTNTKN